jgi:hypothetical protein
MDMGGLPLGNNLAFSKWVFKQKIRVNRTHVKHKTRLVAKGCEQVEGLDYEDMFALMVKWDTLKALVALVDGILSKH